MRFKTLSVLVGECTGSPQMLCTLGVVAAAVCGYMWFIMSVLCVYGRVVLTTQPYIHNFFYFSKIIPFVG